jgi:MSHA biogenesis protein MshN
MSLINKMLQDLDARGTPAAGPMQVHIKPVARDERRLSLPLVGALVAGAAVIAAAGAFGWRYLHKPGPAFPPPHPPVAAPRAPQPAVVQAAPAVAAPVVRAPVASPEAESAPVQAAAEVTEAVPAAVPHKKTRKERREEKARLAAEKKEQAAQARKERREAQLAEKPVAVAPPKKEKRSAAESAEVPATKAKKPGRAAAFAEGRQETNTQRAEGAYRRALGNLQDGRVSEAVTALQQALQVEPKHDAARQTLVGLLIEARRSDEAMRQLQLGLTLDPRQPALAMLLARLQIEHGESGIETLARTLPYAAGNGEYQALLAGALQRQQRHREAAEQYQVALRMQPQNPVWWMGLGISLQAEKRNAEALDAFRKAKASGTLSPELQGFVERKLGQLGR